ncbi:MAG TPA: RIP metalloprotease RseP [Hyphomicrobiaceae bacterium]|nr:RIP metalloprotease RseP [Hyphomicrobiaceae bacterium]
MSAIGLVATLFLLTVVVFFHELGHFLVARWCGVKVKAFSIGFGREICGFSDRQGTRWRLAWIPLGGYVKFMDDENAASAPSREALQRMTPAERAVSFHCKPLWQRAAVVIAGPVANFLLSIAIFATMFALLGVTTMEPRVGNLVPDSPAAAAGFRPGDLVLSIDGREIQDFGELQYVVSQSPGRALTFVVDRGGQRLTLKATPELREADDRIAGKHKRAMIGIQGSGETSKITHRLVSPVEAVSLGVQKTWDIAAGTLAYIGDVIARRQSGEQVGGVIRIADASGQAAKLGLEWFVQLIAVISVSIGLINLFPIPLLDGGHLLFYGIEALRRKPLSERTQEIGFRIGLAVVLMLLVFATWNDRLIVWRWLTGNG